MSPAAVAALVAVVALAIVARATYPRLVERRAERRRPLGSDGVVVGAATIDLPRAGAPGVLLLHGGGDTPQVLAGLANHLHERGFSVRVPLLSGHGRALSAFSTVRATQWHVDTRREYALMRTNHDWVAIVGLSMGGALAIALAAEEPTLPALVLLAPYASMPLMLRGAAVTSAWWGAAYPYFASRGSASVRDPAAAARGFGHGVFTPAALRALHDVVVDASRALPAVRAPALMIQSTEDNRISRKRGAHTFALLGSAEKQLVWVEGAGHVITVDFGYARVFELTTGWLEQHRRGSV
jgi:carboxylesterase